MLILLSVSKTFSSAENGEIWTSEYTPFNIMLTHIYDITVLWYKWFLNNNVIHLSNDSIFENALLRAVTFNFLNCGKDALNFLKCTYLYTCSIFVLKNEQHSTIFFCWEETEISNNWLKTKMLMPDIWIRQIIIR